ncbi:sulfite exporter TauE/SafE family protein [Bacillus suaedae]|uniref:Probable membrane transporter protein n=1 Tax=Halalkalibacter suaedae TaxID=2822140 RepID=A0A941AR30_9BACI|nr:sulfite exporter TauE/SafE family protein [Bacillus suaedae]MBP3951943.1 sulfite exporter TauE/SafE family protein [Bacillus suaedae]
MIDELSWVYLLIVIICAMCIGVTKTGLPTLGILVTATMASIFPARESIGIVLPMLLFADVIAVTYYRRSVNWKTLLSLLPWVLGGLIAGYFLLYSIEESRPIEIILGTIILTLMALQMVKERYGQKWLEHLPDSKVFIGIMGTLAGFTTMVGNAAGPIMSIFLIAIALPKKEFIGTGAWFFLAVNLIKIPMYAQLGLITSETLFFNLWLIVPILVGAYLGIKFLSLIPEKYFQVIILILVTVGGLRLLLG